MKKKNKISGIRKKYLKYTAVLLALAMTLSCIGIWIYVRTSVTENISGKYEFMTERMGIALDTLYQKSDEVMTECILYEDVQKTLQTGKAEEINAIALGKYFAYIDMDQVADYCYVDNKENVYGRSYSTVSYKNVKESGFERFLGKDYSKTKWFWTKDTLFGTEQNALFIGRYVRSLEYAHEPGMMFFKMSPEYLEDTVKADQNLVGKTTIGIIDEKGNLCFSNIGEQRQSDEEKETMLKLLGEREGCGMILNGVRVKGGILSAYRQKESGFTVFSFVPDRVLNEGLTQIVLALTGIYLVILIVAVILSLYFSERFTKPIQVINKAMTGFDGNDFQKITELHTNTELDQIGHSYNEMLNNIEELLAEIKAQERELRTSELNMLISQINPHFLYNTLDTIYMLARLNKEETTMRMIQALSRYLRLSLSKGNDIVTVADELENVKSYMEIQQIRDSNLFSYTVDCNVDAEKTWVLKLILQPLVENSIKYGFCDIFEGGIIRISVEEQEETLCLTVYNNGTSMEDEMCQKMNRLNELPLAALRECFPDRGHGYGVVNIMTRLRLKYGEKVRFCYQAETEGTTCTIQIPGGGRRESENA